MRTKKQHHESIFSKYIGDMFDPDEKRKIEETINREIADGTLIKEVDFRRMLEAVGNKYQVGRMMTIVTMKNWSLLANQSSSKLEDATYLHGFHNPRGNYRCGFIVIKRLKRLLSDGRIMPSSRVASEALGLLYRALDVEMPESVSDVILRARLAKEIKSRKPEMCPCCGRPMPKIKV